MRILLASHVAPWPPASGGSQRTELLRRALARLGEVDLLLLSNPYNRAALEARSQWGELHGLRAVVAEPAVPAARAARWLRRVALARVADAWAYHWAAGRHLLQPDPAAMAALAGQLELGRYTIVVARYLRTAAVCGLLGRCSGNTPPVALDVDDYQPDLLRLRLPRADPLTRLTLRRQLRITEEACQRLLPLARHLWISQPEDRRHPLLANATHLPNLPWALANAADLPEPPLADKTAACLAVIGTWSYSANASGLQHFLDRCWPLVRAAVPAARLVIGGRLPTRLQQRWQRYPAVDLIGFVDDLARFYAQARACLAPVYFGGGTNIKVIEAAAHGRACAVTPVAARGFADSLLADGALLQGGSDAELASVCAALLGDTRLAARHGQQALASARRHFRWQDFQQAVATGVAAALQQENTGS